METNKNMGYVFCTKFTRLGCKVKEKCVSIIPRSLVSRTLWLTLLSVIFAQLIATTIWYAQSKDRELEGLKSTATSMANNFASTANFFQSLPLQYRHMVLNQLRNIGGTRFFVSFNEEQITIDPAGSSEMKTATVEVFESVLAQKLEKINDIENIKVEFSRPENLHVLTNDTLLSDLPKSWAHYTLRLEPLNPPILVVQIKLAANEWLYIAALLPSPYVMLEDEVITNQQLFFIFFITALLMSFTYIMVRRQVKPLKNLAKAANALSTDINQPPLVEEGASELVTATRAFNRMQESLKKYIDDRERLFSAISHDLKTPITRLRIRSELIEDEQRELKFNRDLDELELMVKGALQTVKDTDIHENLVQVDVVELLKTIAEQYNTKTEHVLLQTSKSIPLVCKPLALKRCLSNLVGNGVKYGSKVTITIRDSAKELEINIIDQGPGIPETKMEQVFKPYVRLANDSDGHGLGLGISRSIVHSLGGQLVMCNLDEGGLQVQVNLPRVALR
ncbi:ATP-binding protein [Vibrio sp. TH_r3]|uniref:ATP-binding protein n=1 Tax=unclassified Vibrio TaxID=2614977 RepID=UPI0029556829|nr:ATP-binding protein [Vibrio sp. TH_r3]MDV7104720.1 ATP-binding protein [Vibrio sp. TH_r3]